jgi:uncharacterized protein YyaL (SSP411 family)
MYLGAGEFAKWYSDAGLPGPFYPEITAYAVSLLTIVYDRVRESAFLEIAEQCASRLIRLAKESGGGLPGPSEGLAYTFDTGMYISSLLQLWEVTGKKIYESEATNSLNWLLSHFDGETFAALHGKPDKVGWPYVSSIHLTKLVIPMIRAWRLLGDNEYRDIAYEILRWAGKSQLSSGRFRNNQRDESTNLHPNCYALEGFLFSYYYLKNGWLLDIVKRGLDFLSNVQKADGGLPHHYPRKNLVLEREVTDATAQAVRLWKLAGLHKEAVERAYRFLESCQANYGLLHSRVYAFGLSLSPLRSKLIYSWPTFFYLHSRLLPFNGFDFISELF